MNLSIHSSGKEKKEYFLFQKGKEIYKLRAIHSKGSFSEIKRNTRIPTIQKNRMTKSRNRHNTRSNSTQHQKKIRKHLNINLNLKKNSIIFFLLKLTLSSIIFIFFLI